MNIYCPKCQAANDADADPILCQQCGHEFSINQEATPAPRPAIPISQPSANRSRTGPILALIVILAMTGAYLTGYVPLGLALTIGLIGLLCAVVVQLAAR
jgi:hypothetical protein